MLGMNHKLQVRNLLLKDGNLHLKILATGNAKEEKERQVTNTLCSSFSCLCCQPFLTHTPLYGIYSKTSKPHIPHKTPG
jgi:hypothetical protein